MEKIKYVCVGYKRDERYFTIGNVYEGYPEGGSHMIADDGFEYNNLSVDELGVWYDFKPLEEVKYIKEVKPIEDTKEEK